MLQVVGPTFSPTAAEEYARKVRRRRRRRKRGGKSGKEGEERERERATQDEERCSLPLKKTNKQSLLLFFSDAISPQVSQGFRREVSKTVPPTIRALISDCWAQDPGARPTAQQALERLSSDETRDEIALWSRVPGGVAAQGGCACSIM